MKICKIAHVSGKVQGVFFRAATQQQAILLGIKGYAKNLADGDVEVLVCGEQAAVEKIIAWLHIGPAKAQVSNVQIKELEWQEHNKFIIG